MRAAATVKAMPDQTSTLESLRRRQLAEHGPQPCVTWYDLSTGERTELSNTTFDNWVAKTANLMVELGIGAGDTVAVGLPPHWQRNVWWAAIWAMGAVLDSHGSDASGPALMVCTLDRATASDADETVVCSLLPLGRPLPDPPPASCIDYALDVRTQPDRFSAPLPVATDDALISETTVMSNADVIVAVQGEVTRRGLTTSARLLVESDSDAVLAHVAALLVGGSQVIVGGDTMPAGAPLDRIVTDERTTNRW